MSDRSAEVSLSEDGTWGKPTASFPVVLYYAGATFSQEG